MELLFWTARGAAGATLLALKLSFLLGVFGLFGGRQFPFTYGNMDCRVSKGGIKIRKIFPKNQYSKRKLLYFMNWLKYWWVVKKCKKSDFQSQYSMLKMMRIFLIFFHWKYLFTSTFFAFLRFFDKTYFLNPLYSYNSPVNQLTKYYDFLWKYWFLAKPS